MDLKEVVNIFEECNGVNCNKCPLYKNVVFWIDGSTVDMCDCLNQIKQSL